MDDRLCTVDYSRDPSGFTPHTHSTYEILYLVRGEAEVRFGGAAVTAKAPAAVLVNCLEEHATHILSGEYERYTFKLSRRRLDELLADPQLSGLFRCHLEGAHVSPLNKRQEGLLHDLAREAGEHAQDTFSAQAAACCLKLFLISLAREHRAPAGGPPPQTLALINAVQRELDRRFAEPVRISELAARFYVSKYYLTHLFRAWTGCTPKRYLQLNRISCAKELLLQTDLTVSQIAAKCGFSDATAFIRAFRQETGRTPNAYRRQ